MNCKIHSDQESKSHCLNCETPLCFTCTQVFSRPHCRDCMAGREGDIKRELAKELCLAASIYIAVSLLMVLDSEYLVPVYIPGFSAFLLACAPWGWKSLDSITMDIFPGRPPIQKACYYVVKSWVAFLIGWVVGPYRIFNTCLDLQEIRKGGESPVKEEAI